jgi:hypothetical protein
MAALAHLNFEQAMTVVFVASTLSVGGLLGFGRWWLGFEGSE